MEVSFSGSFKKAFRKRIKNTPAEDVFWRQLTIFIDEPFDAQLKTHKLSGKLKQSWSFTIEYDIRVVFFFTKDKPVKAIFTDIGKHDEVY